MPKTVAWLVVACLFLSGVAGLVDEVVWNRGVAGLLGADAVAHALVLSVFLGGLALGAALFGRVADRVTSPMRLYAWLELGIGLSAVVTPGLLRWATGLFVSVAAPLYPDHPVLVATLKAVFAIVILLPPTLLMGGTLPVVVRALSPDRANVGARVATLYAANSFGGVLGSLAAGIWLVPAIGLDRCAVLAASLNVLAAGLALLAASWVPAKVEGPVADVIQPVVEDLAPPALMKTTAYVMLASGFASLLFETLWIRLLSLVMAGTVHAFALMVSSFIAGIALGARWAGKRTPGWREAARLLMFAELAVAVLVGLAFWSYQKLPWLDLRVSMSLETNDAGYVAHLAFELLLSFAVMALPAFAIGATLPAAARVTVGAMDALGRSFGGIYAWNTLGNVLGAVLGGLVVLPLLGLKGAFLLGVTLNVGCVIALAVRQGARPVLQGVSLAGAVVLLLVAVSPYESRLLSRGLFRQRGSDPGELAEFEASYLRDTSLVFHADGASSMVEVHEWKDGERALFVNGKADASTRGDLQTQLMLGHVPMLLNPAAKDVLVIGFGSGATVAAVLAHGPDVRVTVLEISPEVIEAAPAFAEVNHGCLSDPRVKLVIDDARTFVRLTRERFDVVVSEPSNPWMSGISGLFTKEFGAEVRAVLRPGGLFTQWVPLYETHDDVVRTIVRTVRSSFPTVTGWATGTTDFMLVAGSDLSSLDTGAVASRIAGPEVAASLGKVRVRSLESFLMLQGYGAETLARYAGEGHLHEDAWPTIEYAAAKFLFVDGVAKELLRADERLWPRETSLVLSRVLPPDGPSPVLALELAEVVRARTPQMDSVIRSLGLVARERGGAAALQAAPDLVQRYPDVLFDDPPLPPVPVPSLSGDDLIHVLRTRTTEWSERASLFRRVPVPGLTAWMVELATVGPVDREPCEELLTALDLLGFWKTDVVSMKVLRSKCGG